MTETSDYHIGALERNHPYRFDTTDGSNPLDAGSGEKERWLGLCGLLIGRRVSVRFRAADRAIRAHSMLPIRKSG